MNQNRKDRRKYAKMFGLLKKKNSMNNEQYFEHLQRSIDAGKQIERTFDDEVENSIRMQEAEKESSVMAGLVKTGMSEEQAKEVIKSNNAVSRRRKEKLARKKR